MAARSRADRTSPANPPLPVRAVLWRLRCPRNAVRAVLGAAAAFLVLAGGTALAQQTLQPPTNECGAPPAGGGRVVCDATTYPLPDNATHRGNISYFFKDDESVTTDDDDDYTVFIDGSGLGELRYLSADTSIEGQTASKFGVIDVHAGSKTNENDSLNDMDLTVVAKDVTVDTTDATKNNVRGIFAVLSASSGDLRVEVEGGSYKTGNGSRTNGRAISAVHDGSGDLYMTVTGATIDTTGRSATALDAWHDEFGHVVVTATDTRITTNGLFANAVRAYQRHNDSVDTPAEDDPGHVVVRTDNTHIRTQGYGALGIYANHRNQVGFSGDNPSYGDVRVAVKGGSIKTEHAYASGIYAVHRGVGDIAIDLENAEITAKGAAVDVSGTTYSGFAHGIEAAHSKDGAIDITVRGGTIRALAATGHGIHVSAKSKDGDGFVKQTVRVDGQVSGAAGGIYLNGGGRVFVGPNGFVGAGAAKGSATRMADDGGADTAAIRSEGSGAKLAVSLELDGRKPSEALRGPIVNEKGTAEDATRGPTFLWINGVLMHDENGPTNAIAPNGMYDITNVVLDATTAGRLSLGLAESSSRVSPRAAVYEALPGFLLRVDRGAAFAGAVEQWYQADETGPPVWLRLTAGRGSHKPSSATVGASYDLDLQETALGVDLAFSDRLIGSLGWRLVRGSAEVSSPNGGGSIDAEGYGPTGSLAWRGAHGLYASGRFQAMNYDLDFASPVQGELARGVGATARSWGAEAGGKFALADDATLTARGWWTRQTASLDSLTDASGARLSPADGDRRAAGLGVATETVRALDGGRGDLTLRGSAGVEFPLDDDGTAVQVSGETLVSKAKGSRLLLDLGADWRMKDGATLAAGVSVDGIKSRDRLFSAYLSLRMAF